MAEEKKGFFARLGFGQSNGGGCNCGVQIVSEDEVQQQEEKDKKAKEDAKKSKPSGCCG